MMDVISAIMHDEPPPLLAAAPHLPKELQRIVHKSLKKKRDSRYQSIHDLLTDLKELRDELHIESRLERTAVPDRPERQDSISSDSKLTSSSGGMKYADVKETVRQAVEKDLDNGYFHHFLYSVSFIEREAAAMAENLKSFSGRSDEYMALDLETGSAAFCGKWRSAQDLSRRAIDLTGRSNAGEVAARYAAQQALRIVFRSDGSGLPKGDTGRLRTVLKAQTNKALDLGRNQEILARAALALAAAGQTDEANGLTNELRSERLNDTLLNELWLPLARAAVLLYNGKAKEAIHELEPAERFEKAAEFYPQYLRGLAYLQMGRPKAAVREFDKILDHRGEGPFSSIYPLAQLAIARALKDKTEYEKFFELWKDADADMPALVAAEKEFEALV